MIEIRDIKVSLQALFDIADAEDWIEQQFGIHECDIYEQELKKLQTFSTISKMKHCI
jgi:hypothetical protein